MDAELKLLRQGLIDFHASRFYESHESWEEIWLESENPKKLFLQCMILTAAIGVHFQKHRYKTANRVFEKVHSKLAWLSDDYLYFGMGPDCIKEQLIQMKENQLEARLTLGKDLISECENSGT